MARLGLTAEARGQFAALARLQWQAFLNTSFRTIRNRLELLARIPLALVFASFGLGGAVGLGAGAWYFVHGGRPEYLAALLWPVFAFWQLFPIVASAFTEQFDSSHLLRFPLSFRSYVLVRLAYGLFDPVPAVGALWLLGIAIGTGIGRPLLFPWTVLVLLVFAAFNIILTRMIFSWAERWLARRRTREILSILLFLCLLGFQFSGPLVQRFTGRSSVHVRPLMTEAAHVQRVLPPGLAAEAVAVAARGEPAAAVAYSAGLGVCLAAVGWLLGLRLHAEYRGESLSEAGARPVRRTTRPKVRRGWPAAGLPGPVVAVFEKEIRGFMRSPPLIVILLMPLVVLALVLFGSGGAAHSDAPAFMAHTPDLALPIGAAYALVLLTNLSHNAFGAEG
ncbi:MAG TPA: hypothetical protein VND92_08755, partial [Vicinamibacterales bacterium]|nr:hypothetical protein [Vicinamibacterales bacterium]